MTDLDKQLEESLLNVWCAALDSTSDDFRNDDGELNEEAYQKYQEATLKRQAEIVKQVFADAGYLPHVDAGKHVKVGDKLYITNGVDPLVKVDLAKYTSGQEWYDRFEKELDKSPQVDHLMCGRVICADHALIAARRASGLEQ